MQVKGFHESRNTAFPAFTVSSPPDISPGANQVPAEGFHETRDTKHETRLFYFLPPSFSCHSASRLSASMGRSSSMFVLAIASLTACSVSFTNETCTGASVGSIESSSDTVCSRCSALRTTSTAFRKPSRTARATRPESFSPSASPPTLPKPVAPASSSSAIDPRSPAARLLLPAMLHPSRPPARVLPLFAVPR